MGTFVTPQEHKFPYFDVNNQSIMQRIKSLIGVAVVRIITVISKSINRCDTYILEETRYTALLFERDSFFRESTNSSL